MSDDVVNIEVNGEPVQARKGDMLIQATDSVGVYVPRFCYHDKLSVAANCRMCLVEVEKAPKPLPACATPVAEGMKVFTQSARSIAAQKATMEFLLINHPLDCPICDQGGECELQDLAMGFGRDVSRFNEGKRVVQDKDIGPLVSTDMTRCILCTRCVRFGAEVAGIQELGTIGRGEHMEITTFVERSVDHELSGNIIDLCPVGALNSRPFRFRARSWEMMQRPLVSPHDCVGSNLFAHVHRGKLLRVVPRPAEEINETWISDRDRFSYEGVYSDDRLAAPMLKVDGEWREVGWDTAFEHVVERLGEVLADDPAQLGVLANPSSTLEELYLLQGLARGLGCANIDHRLRMQDFRDQDNDPLYPTLGTSIADLERQDAILVCAAHLRHEAPILAHRLRKAALGGAAVSILNPPGLEYLFSVANYVEAPAAALGGELAGLVRAAAQTAGKALPESVRAVCENATVPASAEALVRSLTDGEQSLVLLGALALRHPAYADLRALAAALAGLTGSKLGNVTEGANSAGACLAGVLPHRGPGGAATDAGGLDAARMLAEGRRAYLLLNVEPDGDCADPAAALRALSRADQVVALTPFDSPVLREHADVLLPVGTFAETDGTFVSVEGRWQSFEAVIEPLGEARAAWKVLRVLANRFGLEGFDYGGAAAVREAVEAEAGDAALQDFVPGVREPLRAGTEIDMADVGIYAVDGVVRRSAPLQATRDARSATRVSQ